MINYSLAHKLGASPAGRQWDVVGIGHHHGIATPLFSIHTKTSCGIGEYLDLIPLIDWCRDIKYDIIQLLPLNDTGLESSPYSALTAFGLNPIHLSLFHLPNAMKDSILRNYTEDLQSTNGTSCRFDYRLVHNKKHLFLRRYYDLFGTAIKARSDYSNFKKKNSCWIEDYAVFKALKIKLKWQPWEEWQEEYHHLSQETLPDDIREESEYHIFLQYLCFSQFMKVQKHADMEGISLKGDIPILINRESADVWKHRNFFLLDLCAGAPPDMYANEGQKWGFPLYNWDALAKENYRWWADRLKVANQLYHIYRIDHIVGFFRIWGIPLSLHAKDGRFIPEDKNQWLPQGSAIMRMMLKECDMLPIGEDLGVVPPEVRTYLRSIGICGTKVMRWERRWNEDKGYIDPKDYPAESMTTVSTHDSETLGQWWANQNEEARLYAETQGWQYSSELTHDQRYAILKASHHSKSLFHINLISEYLNLMPDMSWPNPEDERINTPGVISERNWTYLLKPSLEELTRNQNLKQTMISLIET